jgi:vancomycin resistance protein YoaR
LVYLYGTKPNREVRIEGPEMSNWTPAPTTPVCVENPNLEEGVVRQTDWAVDGVDVRVYRTILVNGEVVSREVFFSPYAAWPNIYEKRSCP